MIIIANVSDTGVQNTPSHEVLTPYAVALEQAAIACDAADVHPEFDSMCIVATQAAAEVGDVSYRDALRDLDEYRAVRSDLHKLARAMWRGAL